MIRYSIDLRARKYVKRYGFLAFGRNLSNIYGTNLLDTSTKRGLDALKTASKKVVYKTAEATRELIGNKIAIAHAPETPTTSILFQINSTDLYVPVITLTINGNIGRKVRISKNNFLV